MVTGVPLAVVVTKPLDSMSGLECGGGLELGKLVAACDFPFPAGDCKRKYLTSKGAVAPDRQAMVAGAEN